MKTRWTIDPMPWVGAWLALGTVAFVIVASLNPKTRAGDLPPLVIVTLCIWLGPFALGLATIAIVFGAMVLWDARPRRITEAVTTDLREHHRDTP